MVQERKERLPGNRAIWGWIKAAIFRFIRKSNGHPNRSRLLEEKKTKQIHISHETIYKWIRENNETRGDLYTFCRHRIKHRKRPVGSAKTFPTGKVSGNAQKNRTKAGSETLKWIR